MRSPANQHLTAAARRMNPRRMEAGVRRRSRRRRRETGAQSPGDGRTQEPGSAPGRRGDLRSRKRTHEKQRTATQKRTETSRNPGQRKKENPRSEDLQTGDQRTETSQRAGQMENRRTWRHCGTAQSFSNVPPILLAHAGGAPLETARLPRAAM
jgi:hypothetical protein